MAEPHLRQHPESLCGDSASPPERAENAPRRKPALAISRAILYNIRDNGKRLSARQNHAVSDGPPSYFYVPQQGVNREQIESERDRPASDFRDAVP